MTLRWPLCMEEMQTACVTYWVWSVMVAHSRNEAGTNSTTWKSEQRYLTKGMETTNEHRWKMWETTQVYNTLNMFKFWTVSNLVCVV